MRRIEMAESFVEFLKTQTELRPSAHTFLWLVGRVKRLEKAVEKMRDEVYDSGNVPWDSPLTEIYDIAVDILNQDRPKP